MKKNTLRRFLALTLSVILCFSLMSTIALAQSMDETPNDTPTIRILTPVDVPDTPQAEPQIAVDAEPHQDESDPVEFDVATSAEITTNGESESAGTDTANGDLAQDETDSSEDVSSSAEVSDDAQEDSDAVETPDNSDESSSEDEKVDSQQPEESESDTEDAVNAAESNESTDEIAAPADSTEESKAEISSETTENPSETPDSTPAEAPIPYGDKGVTADGISWEFTCDSTTGKYTLSFKLDKTSEDGEPAISEETLASMEAYTAEVSRELAEKYGVKWEWDSAAAPSEEEDVQKFQVFLTSEKDHTYKYDSVSLEQMDGEFTIEKVDAETKQPVTGSEASFHLWHVNEVIDSESGEKMDVKMYCSYDAETHTYTFVPTESTIQTIGGKLEILYAMMKDTVYYLQETVAPKGYEVDPNIHIVMEKDVWESKEEKFHKDFSYLGEFTEDEDGRIGLDVKFEDIKTYSGSKGKTDTTPEPTVSDLPTPPEYPVPPEPDPVIVPDPDPVPTDLTPIPVPEIIPDPTPDPIPNPDPVIPTIPEPDPVIDANDIPKTGDMMYIYMLISLISAIALVALMVSGRKKSRQK